MSKPEPFNTPQEIARMAGRKFEPSPNDPQARRTINEAVQRYPNLWPTVVTKMKDDGLSAEEAIEALEREKDEAFGE